MSICDFVTKSTIQEEYCIEGSFTSRNIVDGGWKCRNLFQQCEVYFKNVEILSENFQFQMTVLSRAVNLSN